MSSDCVDVLIIGASAAGLMCAIEAGKRGRRVLVVDHADQAGKKILISGGGRCNFTNYNCAPEYYLSANPHFCKSALARYQYYDFLALLDKHNIVWHEKKLGQLFCDHSAKQILTMLLAECAQAGVEIRLNCNIQQIAKATSFKLSTNLGTLRTHALVVASGGLSIPKIGATDIGYRIATQFEIPIIPPQPGLVPFTFSKHDQQRYDGLSGISFAAQVSNSRHLFREQVLITHRGLSGPAILQISSYWRPHEAILIEPLPQLDLGNWLLAQKQEQPNALIKNILAKQLPKRFVERVCMLNDLQAPLKQYPDTQLSSISNIFKHWSFQPGGTEGYRTAEVTLGGIDTQALSSKTFAALKVEGLYFIGEVVDVTGHLGGYNFQWAWASGYCAGQYV